MDMSENGNITQPTELPRLLVDLIINEDQVAQKWVEFLITIQAGLAVALAFLVRSSETLPGGQLVQSSKVPHAAIYLIAGVGFLVSIGITWMVVRERKWTAWYVHRFNQLPGCHGNVFPADQPVPKSVGSVPLGRFSQIAVGLGSIICLAWVAIMLWAGFYH
jgi:hypothetical protein